MVAHTNNQQKGCVHSPCCKELCNKTNGAKDLALVMMDGWVGLGGWVGR